MDTHRCLDKAIEITKEFARGAAPGAPDVVLENLYKKLKELTADADK
jgi:hypothetical protein